MLVPRSRVPIGLATLTVLLCAACAPDTTSPPGVVLSLAPNPDRAAEIRHLLQQQHPVRGTDEVLSYLQASVPGGVGGMFLEAGILKVYLTDLSEAETARQQLVALQEPGRRRFGPSDIQFIQGQYTWDQLRTWFEKLLGSAMPEALHGYDIDERVNRIRLHLEGRAAVGDVRALLAAADVPLNAAILTVSARPSLIYETLDDDDRPVRGGVAFENQRNAGSVRCTVGANVETASLVGFVTVSHCGTAWGSVDGDSAWQADATPGDFVAIEVADPPFFTHSQDSDCPLFELHCRYTDAAVFEYDSGSLPNQGVIARPFFQSLVIDSTSADFYIQNDNPSCPWLWYCSIVGDSIHKVGQTTGWTVGEVEYACVIEDFSHPVFSESPTYICVDKVERVSGSYDLADGGDSGSPAFEVDGSVATLHGVVFAGDEDEFWFSRIENIRNELNINFTAEYDGVCCPESRAPRTAVGKVSVASGSR